MLVTRRRLHRQPPRGAAAGVGHRVRVLDNLSQGQRAYVPAAAEFIEGDIVDATLCRKACAGVAGSSTWRP